MPRGNTRNSQQFPVFGRPEIVKNFTFWLSDQTFKPVIGTGMAENPHYLIFRIRGCNPRGFPGVNGFPRVIPGGSPLGTPFTKPR